MEELPDCSVHLMVTSPPYNVGKEYDDNLTLDEYRAFLKRVMAEVYRVLVPGGRACINLANLGRRPYLPLHAFVIQDMLELGFLMRGGNYLGQSLQCQPVNGLGQLVLAPKSYASGYSRIYSCLLQANFLSRESP
jgi:SAM-dependent methyltransferase